MNITTQQFNQCCPTCKNPNTVTEALNKILPLYNIKTLEEVAGFISECAHESSDFNRLEENLNYSSQGLLVTWKSHFSADIVDKYARQPEKIANRAYANRMGNGDEASGDGWKYKGRGAIQVTGKDNYTLFAKYKSINITDAVTYASKIEGAIDISAWFWYVNNLNKFADIKDDVKMTKIINGGTIGAADRQTRFNTCLKVLT